MRLGLIAPALALIGAAAPATAAYYDVSISGSTSGNTLTILCVSGPSCPFGPTQRSDPYSGDFSRSVGVLELLEGSNEFHFGSPYSGGLFSGFIVNTGGVLSGRDLSFSVQSCSQGVPAAGCQVTTGTARLFAVSGGVPEPATWAMMLLGFGAIGTAMRRRRRPVPAQVSFAA